MSICYDLIYEEIPKLLLELEPYLPRSQRCFGILRNCRDGWRVTSGQVWRSPGDDRKLIGVVIKSTGTVSVWNLDEEIGRVISATLPQKNLELSSANTDFLRIVRSQVNEPLNVYLLHISEEVFEKQYEVFRKRWNGNREFTLKRLESESDLAIVQTNWPYLRDGSDYLRKRLAPSVPSLGLYLKEDVDGEEVDKLVSWVLLHEDLTIGVLHTDTRYRGRGYARILLQNFTKILFSDPENRKYGIYTHCVMTNQVSIGLLKSLGFVVVGDVHWTYARDRNFNHS
eukprot:TRINITY_DN9990_c0_g1_i1.p1 TRINITY_DN9990_c0_g1~~TRINITY_DN9990_c0_g1_i1.p1  ORF type:complete len:284 (-),score=38.80 TRINITY_DN9990_c0_g1_i1:119-970(-)